MLPVIALHPNLSLLAGEGMTELAARSFSPSNGEKVADRPDEGQTKVDAANPSGPHSPEK
ncbi:hypothetical protein ASG68_08020 [Rhizobium sp. Leaf453]|nr:hypothetical protein ASG50_09045 [Rhizobium sp. Leaf386]KQS94651.1 hypothetical protein ASG42_08250 [Rhizobium sp. Leaf391]KQU01665.1 hypothetical protein ASG68_08020 [Rhizobium sp. Leaf453]